jgi:hypothetical protein
MLSPFSTLVLDFAGAFTLQHLLRRLIVVRAAPVCRQ